MTCSDQQPTNQPSKGYKQAPKAAIARGGGLSVQSHSYCFFTVRVLAVGQPNCCPVLFLFVPSFLHQDPFVVVGFCCWCQLGRSQWRGRAAEKCSRTLSAWGSRQPREHVRPKSKRPIVPRKEVAGSGVGDGGGGWWWWWWWSR